MTEPRVSAVITSYNYGRFLADAVESVLAQGFPAAELQIVVVDDGSTDDTPDRIRQFGDAVEYVPKPHGGQASALNAGFARARANIVALLDADDLWLPGKLQRVVTAFESHPDAVMVQHSRFSWYCETNSVVRDPDSPALSGNFPPLAEDLLRYGPTATSALAFRKDLLGDLLPIPEILTGHADSYLSAFAILQGRVVGINEPLAKYRIHDQNLYAFAQADEKRVARRLAQLQTFVSVLEQQMPAWQEKYAGAGLGAYLARFRLIEQEHRFAAQGAGRLEFFRYLRMHERVYRPLWSARYRIYRHALAAAGFVLGYRTFERLRDRYRRSSMREFRNHLLPVEMEPAPAQASPKAVSYGSN